MLIKFITVICHRFSSHCCVVSFFASRSHVLCYCRGQPVEQRKVHAVQHLANRPQADFFFNLRGTI